MKQGSARLIIVLLLLAAIFWLYSGEAQKWPCSVADLLSFGGGTWCREIRHALAPKIAVVILVAAAALVWTRQLKA